MIDERQNRSSLTPIQHRHYYNSYACVSVSLLSLGFDRLFLLLFSETITMSPKQEMDFKDFSIGCCQGLDKPTKRAILAPEYDVLWGFFIGQSTG